MNPMNQNTTIETIREAIEYLDTIRSQSVQWKHRLGEIRTSLQDLANELEAAPLIEQPPVEQSEPKSGVWIAGQWREIREGGFCPNCSHKPGDCIAGTCAWQCFHVSLGAPQARTHIWLAPAAVIEPEPELDEFEKWATELIEDTDFHARYLSGVNDALKMYRVTRKGDK